METEIVFYKGWFRRNQKWLLLLVNNFFGRNILKINGDRSDVGKNKIIKIEPHAITWFENGEYKTEFRTHAKFAKRLYYGLYPIWWLMHQWDIFVANPLYPKFNLGFDTLTVYPNSSPEINTVDGYVGRAVTNETFSTLRSSAGNFFNDSSAEGRLVRINSGTTSNQFREIDRSIMLFDTSSLGSLAQIISAEITINANTTLGHYVNTFSSDFLDINIYSSNPASDTALAATDYGSVGSSAFSTTKSYAVWANGNNTFTLNATGISSISKTSVSKFGTRSASHDVANSAPTWESFKTSAFTANFADQTGTSSDPKLVVTYGTEAYVTNSVSFEIEQDIPLTITNTNNGYLKYELYVNSVLIKTANIGQVTSHTISTSGAEESAMYAQVPNATSVAMSVRIKTYLDSGYTTQIGGNRDQSGTATVNTTTNKPTFTTYTLENVDKTINVTDSYGNIVVSSSTATLIGISTKFIKAYSKVRAVITTANKMVAKNSATADYYRFTNSTQFDEEDYSAVSTVNLDIDNATVNSFSVAAYDSRGLATSVANTMAGMADYSNLVLTGLSFTRDNSIEAPTKLVFTGTLWNKYFGSNTTSNPGYGVLNDLTTHYRWKPTTRNWDSLNGTVTMTIASPCVLTKTAHGFTVGQPVFLTTTGALPTGLTANTVYYVIEINANTFSLATSYANAVAGTAINTSGSQSGTHTIKCDPWLPITASVNGSGAITHNAYIDGNLGSGGFTADNSYSIQVRGYDRLSVTIIEGTLSVGTPLAHYTKNGIGVGAEYNTIEGGKFQVQEYNVLELSGNMNRQALINGNFDIWQRGFTGSGLTASNNSFGPDRWRHIINADGGTSPTITSIRDDDIRTSARSHWSWRHNWNNTGTSLGNNSYHGFAQKILKGTQYLSNRWITISFYVVCGSPIAGKKIGVRVIRNYGTGGSPSTEQIINGSYVIPATNFTRQYIVIDLGLKNTGYGTNNDDYLDIQFLYQWGSGVASTVGDISAEGFIAANTTTPGFQIAQVQVNAGKYVLPFSPKSVEQELFDCEFYYQKTFPYTTTPAQNSGSSAGAIGITSQVASVDFGFSHQFKRTMRTTPTVTTYNPNAANANWRDITNSADRTVSLGSATTNGIYITGTSGAAGARNAIHLTAEAEL